MAISLIFASAALVSADTLVSINGFSFYTNSDGEAVIAGCDKSLTDIEIPDSLINAKITEIANNAFWGNGSLKSVSFEKADGLHKIGSNAFCGCTAISSVALPYPVELGYGAFQGCTELESFSAAEGLTNIPVQAFNGCEKLCDVRLPDSLTSIDDYAFANCASLSTITIPASVTYISNDAFPDSPNVTIRCDYGSAAYTYAIENNITCSLLDPIDLGDANNDGVININDVTAIQRHVAEMQMLEGLLFIAADVTQNGKIEISDATTMQMYFAEYNITEPIGEKIVLKASDSNE